MRFYCLLIPLLTSTLVEAASNVDENGNAVASGYEYLGCFSNYDSNHMPKLNYPDGGVQTSDPSLTNAKCIANCAAQGYAYSGTTEGQYCFCGHAVDSSALRCNSFASLGGCCNTFCTGNNPNEYCGAYQALSIYGPVAPGTQNIGCYVNSVGDSGNVNPLADSIQYSGTATAQKCRLRAIAQGHSYFALTYYNFCDTGNTIAGSPYALEDAATSFRCEYQCDGDPTQQCGGDHAYQMYSVIPLPGGVSTASYFSTATQVTTTTTTATTISTQPASTITTTTTFTEPASQTTAISYVTVIDTLTQNFTRLDYITTTATTTEISSITQTVTATRTDHATDSTIFTSLVTITETAPGARCTNQTNFITESDFITHCATSYITATQTYHQTNNGYITHTITELSTAITSTVTQTEVSTVTASGPVVTQTLGHMDSYTFLGCAGSPVNFDAFVQVEDNPTMTIDRCVADCEDHRFAAVFNTLCYCSDSIDPANGQPVYLHPRDNPPNSLMMRPVDEN